MHGTVERSAKADFRVGDGFREGGSGTLWNTGVPKPSFCNLQRTCDQILAKPMYLPRVPSGHSKIGTEEVPQRNCVTKILPNVRVNFLVRFAQNPCFTG